MTAPKSFSHITLARTDLERISKTDPIFRPASFLLGVAYLYEGDCENAAIVFESLVKSLENEIDKAFDSVPPHWSEKSPRWIAIGTYLPSVRNWLLPYVELWLDISHSIHGGILFQTHERWTQWTDRIRERKTYKKNRFRTREIADAIFNIYLDSFPGDFGIKEEVRKIFDKQTSAKERKESLGFINYLFRGDNISELDEKLKNLENQLPFLSLEKTGDITKSKDEKESYTQRGEKLISEIAELPEGELFFKVALEMLKKKWSEGNREGCELLLKQMRDYTRAPDKTRTRDLIENALRIPLHTVWCVCFFLPSYRLLDELREQLANGFFVEAKFYLARARYRTFRRDGYIAAKDFAFQLWELHLQVGRSRNQDQKRFDELRIMVRCLEACAAARLAMTTESDDDHEKFLADSRANELIKTLWPNLEEWARNKSLNSSVRAAAFESLGLLDRYQASDGLLGINKREASKGQLWYFKKALDLERSADACFYIAETLLGSEEYKIRATLRVERYKKEKSKLEAEIYVDEALRICAKHPGALALRGLIQEMK